MAAAFSRAFKPLHGSLDNRVGVLSGNWAIGATGAVGAQVGGTGMSLSRSGVGTYQVQLTGLGGVAARVPAILHPMAELVTSDTNPTDDTDAFRARILGFDASAGTIDVQTFDEAGVVRDPVSGATLCFTVFLRMSSATR